MEKIRRALKWILLLPLRLIWWIIKLPFLFLGWLFRPVVNKFKKNKIYLFLNDVPEDRPALEAVVEAFQSPEEILGQLDDVRRHLLRSLLVLVLMVGVSFWFTQDLITFLAQPVGGISQLQAIEVTESISVYMKVALIAGIALATPYISFELWLFFAPGIMPRSKQLGLLSIPLALVFFVGGMAFAYYAMLPTALPFLIQFLGITTRLRPLSYFDFITSLMFWIGVAFEFPLVIFGISAMGFVKPQTLLKQWRLAVVLISVLAAVITPTVDPVNMALVMAPMTGLYFLSILFSWLAQITSRAPVNAQAN
ncbi:MAG: twin-arginine translocase subunit TatC [Chloroflexota bacterium]